ncbi:MAG: hypothetical protein AB8U53_00165 [Rickettsia aeschlimannii]
MVLLDTVVKPRDDTELVFQVMQQRRDCKERGNLIRQDS